MSKHGERKKKGRAPGVPADWWNPMSADDYERAMSADDYEGVVAEERRLIEEMEALWRRMKRRGSLREREGRKMSLADIYTFREAVAANKFRSEIIEALLKGADEPEDADDNER